MKSKASAAQDRSASREELLALMFELGRLMKSEIHREASVFPSYLHAEMLRFIQEEGQPTMRQIAEYLKVTPPTVTALIDPFVDDHVLERVADETDRRKVRLRLTKHGEKLLEKNKQQRTEAFARIFLPLSDEECSELARLLAIITRPNIS